jgi:hypothetical protein
MIKATFVTRGGQLIVMPVIRNREHGRDKLFVQRENGVLVDFSDPLDDGNGPLSFVAVEPPDASFQPINNARIRNLQQIRL